MKRQRQTTDNFFSVFNRPAGFLSRKSLLDVNFFASVYTEKDDKILVALFLPVFLG